MGVNEARVQGTLREYREDKYAVTAIVETGTGKKGPIVVGVRCWRDTHKAAVKGAAPGSAVRAQGGIRSRLYGEKVYTDFEADTLDITSDTSAEAPPVDTDAAPF